MIVNGGGVKCWGDNNFGQLGIGSIIQQNSPVDVDLGPGVWALVFRVPCMKAHMCQVWKRMRDIVCGWNMTGPALRLGRGRGARGAESLGGEKCFFQRG